METLTVISDGNPDFLDAIAYLEICMQNGKVQSFTPGGSVSMGQETLTVFVIAEYREEVVSSLKALKYTIVEGE